MSRHTLASARGLLRQAAATVRTSEPRAEPSRRAVMLDIVLAGIALVAALIAVRIAYYQPASQVVYSPLLSREFVVLRETGTLAGVPWIAIVAAVVTTVPLALRRLAPLTAFAVVLVGALATSRYATDISFLAVIFAGYSAVAHSRYRGAALLGVPVGGLAVIGVFWGTAQGDTDAFSAPGGPGAPWKLMTAPSHPWRGTALLVLVSLLLITIICNAVQAREARARLREEHEAAMRRAVEQERARIAAELHDVVTHSVSVMIVQAGAARQVLAETPGEARAALLAVEASGRAAMTELRHLLGLLSPSGSAGDSPDSPEPSEADLRPQPGLAQLERLVGRVSAAGLPVDLHVGDLPHGLPPGLDLAAFRVIQEALTNVLKHAGKAPTSVRVDCRDGDLVLEVADAGAPFPAAVPAVPGAGRGLMGLRERTAVYGGRLEAGPAPGGGWLLSARIPLGPLPPGSGSPGSGAPGSGSAGSGAPGSGAPGSGAPGSGAPEDVADEAAEPSSSAGAWRAGLAAQQ